MKKALSYMLVVLLMIGSCLGFTACSNSTENYERIELTAENYEKYIAFNTVITDYSYVENPVSHDTTNKYILSCVLHIYTYSKQPNITFENVNIDYDIANINDWHKYGDMYFDTKTNISYIGYSEVTVHLHNEYHTVSFYPNSSSSFFSINSISGLVRVGK